MTQPWKNFDVSDDEDGDEDGGYGGRDGIIFLVDCSKSMFEEDKFSIALETIETVMKNRIIKSDRDLIGIVFFNTEKTPPCDIETEVDFPIPKNGALFIPFDCQTANNIQTLMDFRRSPDFNGFDSKYGHSDACNLSDIIWLCSRMFSRCGYKLRATSIVLFTDNALPYPKGSREYQQVLQKAYDLSQHGVNVSLIPMTHDFNGELFYKQFLCSVFNEEIDAFQMPTFDGNIASLSKRIYRRDYRKRANTSIEFVVTDSLKFGVSIYSMSRRTKYPASVQMDRKTEEVIVKKRFYQEQDADEIGGKKLLPGDQCKSIEFGGEKIIFTSDEHSRIKTIIPKGFKLLGFKPASTVSVYQFVNPCLFLYPDDSRIIGSTKIFKALWERCLKRQKVAIGALVQKFKSVPTYVALIPQDNVFHKDDLVRNNGFRIIFLPYKDDIRELGIYQEEINAVEDDDKELFRKLVKKIKFKYNPSVFENPVLQKIYQNIESIVYKEDEVEFDDSTMRHLEIQAVKTAEICEEIVSKFGSIDVSGAKKRPAAGLTTPPPAKIAKSTGEADIMIAFHNNRENSLTVAELKAYLKMKDVKFGTAKKGDLILKIREILDM